MSVQILLQGRLFGAEQFLAEGDPDEAELAGRSLWISLLPEVLPRALIEELNLSKMLLGSSGGGQFLAILPSEVRSHTEEFLVAAQAGTAALSGGRVQLRWAITENLGDWTVVRKRLNEEMQRKTGTPLAGRELEPTGSAPAIDSAYFADLGAKMRDSNTVAWRPEAPARIGPEPGKHVWSIGSGSAGADTIPLARHTALDGDGPQAAGAKALGIRAQGRSVWGVLRGDVDNFVIRIRRAHSIEEHVQLSVLYKQFFAGELEVLCSMGDFWRKVTLLYAGGQDFAVYGAWDALIGFARELQRLFQRFAEEHLKEFPGADGKTITMALALPRDEEASVASVYEHAGRQLALAKAADKDCFYLFGRTIEWKQVGEAAGLRDQLARMVEEFGAAPGYIRELCAIYRESPRNGPRESDRAGSNRRLERPWRFHRRLNRILGASRLRDFQKARASLAADLAGKNPSHLKLRPSGRVALEWARLSTEAQSE